MSGGRPPGEKVWGVGRFAGAILGHAASPAVGDRDDVIDGIVHHSAATEIVVVVCRVWRARRHAMDASVKVTFVKKLRTVTMTPSAWRAVGSCHRVARRKRLLPECEILAVQVPPESPALPDSVDVEDAILGCRQPIWPAFRYRAKVVIALLTRKLR